MITCNFENGDRTSLRHVTVGVIAVNEKNQVLLVKRASNIIRGGKFAMPGGFLDRDEDVYSGALRELKEETGLDGKKLFLFRLNDSPKRPKEDRQNVDVILVAEVMGEGKLNKEVGGFKWVSEDDLPKDEDFAFDHLESIKLYFDYLKKSLPLPIFDNKLKYT